MIPCHFCGLKVDPKSKYVVREVTGWTPVRSAGGVNQVIQPTYSGRHAHRTCVDTALIDAGRQEHLL